MKIAKIILVALAAVGLGWLTIGLGYAEYLRTRNPERALAMFPPHARARADAAEAEFRIPGAQEPMLTDVVERARGVLQRDPTVVDAWHLIGAITGQRRDQARAGRIMNFAERLSRRHLQTQLWLLNEAGGRGRVEDMIAHLDTALRTSPASGPMLATAMIGTSADPRFARRLVPILASDPPWQREFAYQLANSIVPGNSLVVLVAALADDQAEREIMAPLVQRLVSQRDFTNAWNVYRLLKQRPDAVAAEVRDGGFDDRAAPIAPFDWTLGDTGRVRGERRAGGSRPDGVALFIRAEPGARGSAATQLMLVDPGSYNLRFQFGRAEDANAAGIDWRIYCSGAPERILGQGRLTPARPAGSRFSQNVTIPAGCPAQVLSFGARGDSSIGASESWIDDVALVRQ
jgi:hypothetical protein